MRTPAPFHRRSIGRRSVSILGATGSVGESVVDILRQRADAFDVVAVTAQSRAEELAAIAIKLGAKLAVIGDPAAYRRLAAALEGSGIDAAAGPSALIEASSRSVDLVVAAIVGSAGLAPTLAAVEAGADIALANKECLVCAGDLFMARATRAGINVLPVDSEHNAIFQALDADNVRAVERITLTASGGPFRTWSRERMQAATLAEALKHPNWSMGRKITIDSATLMNKGLELIEAHHLFDAPPDRLDVLIHPQSVVHGFVTYADGSMIAQMGAADMRVPVASALAWPAREAADTRRLDLAALGTLTFEKPDFERFSALAMAKQALASGNWATNIMNAANEIAVEAFLTGAIGFLDIAAVVESTLDRASAAPGIVLRSVDEALALDAEGRRLAGLAIVERRGRSG